MQLKFWFWKIKGRDYLVGRLVVYLTTLFSVTRLHSVDDRVSDWWWIGKDLVGTGRDLILRYYPGIHLEGLKKSKKNLNQDSRSPGGREENPGPPEYEVGVLTTRPRRSVETTWESLDIKGRILLKWALTNIGCKDVEWINLVHEGVQWRAVVNTSYRRVPSCVVVRHCVLQTLFAACLFWTFI
jgi:hypothetical protein